MDSSGIRDARETGIVIQEVSKVFNGHLRALDSVSAKSLGGSLTAVLGPSGCGKTTLLRILCGLEPPTSGTVQLGAERPEALRLSGRIGMAFQEPALLPWRTVTENILLALQLRSSRNSWPLASLISLFKLSGAEHFYPSQLSGGMAQRVAVARALVSRPDVLLLDEPFGALDWFLRRQVIRDFEAAWIECPATAVLVTHDTREAVFLADRIEIMSQRPGRVIASLDIDLPRPRPSGIFSDPTYRSLCDEVDSLCSRSYE